CAGLLAPARAEPAHARVEHHGSGPTPAVLRAGDVYVSVGGDWDDNDLGQLYKRKRRDGFMVLGFCYDMIPVKFPHLTIP
ncbi:hypothetical protein, partial [Enterococcus casseliflavus]|uniref:hypothetical protein n=1 Tax=Enterococcus casseliflavus TaxID=37734 RepID=UPI003D127212